MTALLDMTPREAFAWIRERAPSAGEIAYAVDGYSRMPTIYLERATLADAQRLRISLGLMAPVVGPFRVEITGRTHIYFWQGRWWTTRNGRRMWRRGITLNDMEWVSFDAILKAHRV